MKNKKLLFIALLFLILFPAQIDYGFGHGWGIDTTSIKIDNRDITISVEIPQDFDERLDKVITISAIDKFTKENVKNITFLIGLYYENKLIFKNYFFTPDGNLNLYVIPKSEGETKIIAERDSFLDAWYATDSQPIQLEGPIFESGGLYNFEIELRTIDEPTNIVENLEIYNVDVSMVQTEIHSSKNILGDLIDFKTKSYFDKVLQFNYEPQNNIVTFKMPFDWNEKTVSHIPVVHTEIHFPKDFIDFLKPSYKGQINGIDLFKSNVIIDDFTEEKERIVHFVILQDHLQYLKQEQKRNVDNLPKYMLFTLEASDLVNFPMNAMTRDEKFSVDLSWDPIEIEPGKNTKFVFTIRDGATGEPLRQSTYDFVILQNNIEVHRNSGNAEVGGDFEDYTFSESQTGPTVIRFENIRGTGSATEFGLVVIPEFGFLTILVLATCLILIIPLRKNFLNFNY
jgi:predicted secreted protein with PEFG-CTERM motif